MHLSLIDVSHAFQQNLLINFSRTRFNIPENGRESCEEAVVGIKGRNKCPQNIYGVGHLSREVGLF